MSPLTIFSLFLGRSAACWFLLAQGLGVACSSIYVFSLPANARCFNIVFFPRKFRLEKYGIEEQERQ